MKARWVQRSAAAVVLAVAAVVAGIEISSHQATARTQVTTVTHPATHICACRPVTGIAE